MKLLSVQLARAIWLADANEFNPRGLNMFAQLVPIWVERYGFKVYPKMGDDPSDGMKFSQGEFKSEALEPLVVSATVYNDGIIADTFASTKDSEDFLDEMLKSLPEFGLVYEPEMIRQKHYLSQVFIRTSARVVAVSEKLNMLASKVSETSGQPFYLGAFEFWPDQTQSRKPANFSFQKKTGSSPADDRYWSQAPLSTNKHLEMLQELESILS